MVGIRLSISAWPGDMMLENILEYTSLQNTVVYTMSQTSPDTKAKVTLFDFLFLATNIAHLAIVFRT